jgi:CBS domain-containing protein
MSQPVHTIYAGGSLRDAQLALSKHRISSLAVVDESDGHLLGIISMTDLIRVGRRQAGSRAKSSLLTLPEMQIERRMTKEVICVSPETSIADAARKMIEAHIHRVYVEEESKLVGILSTRDIMLALAEKKSGGAISDWMSSPAFSIRVEEPIALATERLERAGVSGLVALDDGWPVGLFTQREALESQDRDRNTPVEQAMNSAMLALDVSTPLHRAAAQAGVLRVRRVIAIENQRVVGILTGLDFARAAA